LRSLIERVQAYRVTRSGLIFTTAFALAGLVAMTFTNNLLFLVLSAMLAIFLVSGFISRLCLAGLQLDFQLPEHVPAGRWVPGRIFVHNKKWLMPSFSIRVEAIRAPERPVLKSGLYFPLVAAGKVVQETVEARFPRRGAYKQNSFAFLTSFPFGFLEKSARVTLSRETLIYPSIDPQPGFEDLMLGISGEIETYYRGLGRDFYRIRPYEAFESARHVDWKASAKLRTLQVREFAREQEQTVEIYLDREISPDLDAWFEHAVDCCAFLAWRLAGDGAAIRFRSQGFDFRLPEEGDIYTILKFLAMVYPQGGNGPEPPLLEDSYKLVFTPSPRRFHDAGWATARILDPSMLASVEQISSAAAGSSHDA
jgi:uncharacterized protein (DUF58 family)